MLEHGLLGGLLQAGVVAHRLLLGVVVLAGAALIIWAVRNRRGVWAVAGVLVALSPLLLLLLGQRGSQGRMAERVAEVRALPRHPLLPQYPRQLLVEGDLAPATAASLLVLGYFEGVEVRAGDYHALKYALLDRGRDCTEVADKWLFRVDDPRRSFDGQSLVTKLKQCAVSRQGTPELPADADAVVLRTDTNAKHRTAGQIWANGAVEIVLRHNRSERLVDYQERPYEERRMQIDSPLSQSMPAGQELDYAKILLAALPRSAAVRVQTH